MPAIEQQFQTHNEFRSDTFTVPTQKMLESVFTCTLGDSVYKEDQDCLDLEDKVARLSGHESALFCSSGTMSNQIALRAHLFQPPHSILCDYRAHVYTHEAGGLATLSQAMVSPIIPSNGNYLTLEDIMDNYIPDDGDIHMAPTKVISLENTLHGIITPFDEIERISYWCKEMNIRLHCDGARLWNASVETGIPIYDYCQLFDSVSLCLSKSLGAPFGSILVGNKKFIEKCNHFKKQNGGGIRQAGMLAKMASIAIDDNLNKIIKSHEYAKDFAKFCIDNNIPLESPVDTSFVFLDSKKVKINPHVYETISKKYNVKTMGNRIAFHYQNSVESIENLKCALLEAYQDSLINPYITKGASKLYRTSSVCSAKTLIETVEPTK
jgi:threonine aldolase